MTTNERVTQLEKQVRVLQQIVFRLDKGAKKRPAEMALSRTAARWAGDLDAYKNRPVEGDVTSTECDECGTSDYYDGATLQVCARCGGDYCATCVPSHDCEPVEADHGEDSDAAVRTTDADPTEAASNEKLVGQRSKT